MLFIYRVITIFLTKPTDYVVKGAERHFPFNIIIVSTTKADYTIEVLPESIFNTSISPWSDMQTADILYKDLKAILLMKFCPTSSAPEQRILDLPLLQLLDINRDTWSHKQLDLPNEIWLMCLTSKVRSTLVENDAWDTIKLVEEAEAQHNIYLAATRLRHSALPTSDITAVRHRHTRYAQHTPPTEPFICWYHLFYVMATKLRNDKKVVSTRKKLIMRPCIATAAATYDTGSSFHITYQLTGTRYLIDTGTLCTFPSGSTPLASEVPTSYGVHFQSRILRQRLFMQKM